MAYFTITPEVTVISPADTGVGFLSAPPGAAIARVAYVGGIRYELVSLMSKTLPTLTPATSAYSLAFFVASLTASTRAASWTEKDHSRCSQAALSVVSLNSLDFSLKWSQAFTKTSSICGVQPLDTSKPNTLFISETK